jgi:hypothetical protein
LQLGGEGIKKQKLFEEVRREYRLQMEKLEREKRVKEHTRYARELLRRQEMIKIKIKIKICLFSEYNSIIKIVRQDIHIDL